MWTNIDVENPPFAVIFLGKPFVLNYPRESIINVVLCIFQRPGHNIHAWVVSAVCKALCHSVVLVG